MTGPTADAGEAAAAPQARWVPLALDLAGRRVVCVGGGRVAARKLDALDGAGAELVLVAPTLEAPLAEAVKGGAASWVPRPYADGDLAGSSLALAATADTAVNEQVAAHASARGIPCVRVDASHASRHPGDAALPATVRRGPLTLAVSTSGASPALAARIRAELAERYDESYGELARLLAELRVEPRVAARLAELDDDARRARWHAVLEGDTLRLIRGGHIRTAREVAIACLCSSSD